MDTSNASEPGAQFQVENVPHLNWTTLVPGDNRTLSLPKGRKVEGIRSWNNVEFLRPLTSLQHETWNTERHLY